MDLTEFRLANSRNRHPWETARATSLNTLLKVNGIKENCSRILDVGCGDAFTISEVFKGDRFQIDAVDTSLSPELLAAFAQKYPTLSFYPSTQTLPKNHYDTITLFDVIEHIENDRAFLQEISTLALPNALFLLTAPAFQSLFSRHDKFLSHKRRYNRQELENTINSAGLQPISSGYLFSSLLLFRACAILWERVSPSSKTPSGVARWRHGKFVTSIISGLLSIENRVSLWLQGHGIHSPGLSVWVLCRKPQS